MDIKHGILIAGNHRIKLEDIEGIREIRPEGKPAYVALYHIDRENKDHLGEPKIWQTIIPGTFDKLETLLQNLPENRRKGWLSLPGGQLLNLNNLPASKSEAGSGHVGGQTHFHTTRWEWIREIGQAFQYPNFVDMRTAAMAGNGLTYFSAKPLKAVFPPRPGPRPTRSGSVATKEAA
jgi:hypothetical protein